MAGVVVSLGFAVCGGLLSALFIRYATRRLAFRQMYLDSEHFHTPASFEPFEAQPLYSSPSRHERSDAAST
jgi:hypothetical protein